MTQSKQVETVADVLHHQANVLKWELWHQTGQMPAHCIPIGSANWLVLWQPEW